jgi:hypothetical protein
MNDLSVVVGVVAAIGLCCLAVLAYEIAARRPRSLKQAVADLRRFTERPAAAPLAYRRKREAARAATPSRQAA